MADGKRKGKNFMTDKPATQPTDNRPKDSRTIYGWRRWRFMFGITEALDGGWRRAPGSANRLFAMVNQSVPQAPGIGVITGKYLWAIWWCKRDRRDAKNG